jgi:hypothetical protein
MLLSKDDRNHETSLTAEGDRKDKWMAKAAAAHRLQLNENSILHTITLEISPDILDYIFHHVHVHTRHIGRQLLLLPPGHFGEGRHSPLSPPFFTPEATTNNNKTQT